MIYLTDGNTPLNEAYNDEIVQERNNTYQLTFRFPTSDPKWELLKEETFLTADDLHGEQDFYIFEVEKQQGYIQVYANQVISLLNNYIVSSIDVDRVSGTRALSALAGSITRANPFSFFSDIDDRHTLNIKDKNAMEVLAKDKHSILGQWGGDMVRNGYNLRLLKNGGSENESLFMYKKNLSSYQHKTSTKSLKTRITFKTTVKGEGEKAPDVDYVVVIDSPLLGKYSQIYEAVVEVNDQNVKDQASLIEYGKQYFRTSMCDMLEDNLEISVVGQSDVAVRMFDVVSIYHEWYGLDVRKKITKYIYSPMAKRLKSIGFGAFQSSLANAIGGIVNDAVLNESRNLHQIFEERLKKEIANANRAFDAEFAKHEKDITDGIELAKAKAEEVKQELSDTINQRFDSFDNGPLKEAKRKAEEALRNAGASSLLAQEAKRIGLDSTAKLEEFKRQATSAQTALSGDLDALKRTVMNDIRPKQEQVTAEIAKQVEALVQTKKELAGVKSAQATYEETTTRRFAELTNLANGKASKSELTQTAEELASKIASVQASGRNLFLNSLFKQDISKTRIWTTSTYEVTIDSESKYLGHNALKIVGQDPMGRDGNNPKITYPALGQFGKVIAGSTTNQDITITFYAKANKNGIMLKSRLGNIWYKTGNVTLSTEIKRYVVHIPKSWTNESKLTTNEWLFTFNQEGTVWIWMPKFEISDVDTSYSEAPEDMEGQISAVESNFRQRADSLDASVRSLTEGLRTKADISELNVTAENIRQSVKKLETDTQNKLNQKLSQAEFEVQAGSIRQEILNATKDKADKTLVVAEAGKLREEFSKMKVGSRNYAEDYDFSRGLWYYSQGDNSPQDWIISNGEYNVKGTTNTWKQMQIQSKEGSRSSWKGSTSLLDLEVGETYTLSFQGICYSGSSSVWLSLRANRTAPSNPEIMYGNFNLTSSWQTYQVTIPALTKPENFDFWRIILGYNEIGHVAFRKVELTRSSTRIDAGPAPEDGKTDLVVAKSEFQKTADGLSAKLATVENYVGQDGQRQEALRRYTREESAKQATSVRELVTRDYVGKSAYQEDVRGIEHRLEAITNPQNGSIATQIAKYKTAVDGRFADITSMISGKANQTDFQRVRETSQLYERILGNSENGIADKVARMALTNQLFQVEVAKAAKGGRNYIRGIKEMRVGSGSWDSGTFRGSGSGSIRTIEVSDGPVSGFNKAVRIISSDPKGQIGVAQDGFEIMPGTYTMSVWIKGSAGQRVRLQNYWWSDDFTGISPEFILKDDKWTYLTFSSERKKAGKLSIGYVYLVNGAKGSYLDILAPQLEEGSIATSARPALEDTEEAVRSVQSQLAGSWSVQNINSAGDLISGLNLGANGHNRLDGKLTHITGETLIDRAVIKSAMVDKLKTANFEAGSVTTTILDAEAVTAEKLKVDFALVRKLTANDAFIEQLTSKRIFSTKVESVVSSSTFLEAYQGRIGGFTIGRFDQGRGRWISGINQFSVGMGNGEGGSYNGENTAFWANWGYNWNSPGPNAWYVTTSGNMHCRNGAAFHGKVDFSDRSTVSFYSQPFFSKGAVINGDLQVSGRITYSGGEWLYSPRYKQLRKSTEQGSDWLYLDIQGNYGSDWIHMNKVISDRRYKSNIQDSQVSGLDVIEKLKTYSYRKEYDGKIEDISCGIMAQDVQKYAPEAFYKNPDGAYTYETFALVPYLIKAIQELNQKIEKMEKTIA